MMFDQMAKAANLGLVGSDSPAFAAFMEAFAMHARVLFEFLWAKSPRPDDVVAEDYVSDWGEVRPPVPPALEKIREKVGKQLAHLTYTRQSTPEELRGWAIEDMHRAMVECFGAFIRRVSRDLLISSWQQNPYWPLGSESASATA
jgi:hypothetical protein